MLERLTDLFEFIGVLTFGTNVKEDKCGENEKTNCIEEEESVNLPSSKLIPDWLRGICESMLRHVTVVLGDDELATNFMLLHLSSKGPYRIRYNLLNLKNVDNKECAHICHVLRQQQLLQVDLLFVLPPELECGRHVKKREEVKEESSRVNVKRQSTKDKLRREKMFEVDEVIDGFLSLFLLIQNGNSYEFMVGGSGDWSLASTAYNQWAERSRFQIGDTVLFNYQAGKDSVVQVSKEDYNNCNSASPIAKYTDGHSKVKLDKSGPHYFISGLVENCKNNEKIVIVVMADRSNPSSPPSPAPAGEESPSPPPASEEFPSPPPAPATEDYNPTSPPSAASSVVTSFIFSIVAFGGSSLLFVF
ncbi:early nodulin-like protein 1 [Tanacetum coccineum]|uniref:Early nodulin-like protein 1 n=1 Tax=Tanacetum coccineum TaxID=301880 RepID=A0ABQ5G3X7_9ASTR